MPDKKPNICHLYAYGDIYNAQGSDSAEYGVVSLTGIMKGYNSAKGADADEILLHIHTLGGDMLEAFAIFDYLGGLGKPINTVVDGVCASAGTILFLRGTERTLSPNSRFLIHNPWLIVMGNADEIAEKAERLRQEQERLLDFYENHTGSNREALSEIMNQERYMEAEEAKDLGFATNIVDQIKAMALMQNRDHLPEIFKKENKPAMAKNEQTVGNLAAFMSSVKTLANELLGVKNDAGKKDKADESGTPEEKAEDADDTANDGKSDGALFIEEAQNNPPTVGNPAELEQANAKIKELEDKLAAATATQNSLKETLEIQHEALKHMKSEFVPASRENTFNKAGTKTPAGNETDAFKEKLKKAKEKAAAYAKTGSK